jgi:membrane protein
MLNILLNPKNKYVALFGEKQIQYMRDQMAALIKLLRRVVMPGSGGLPMLNVLRFFGKGLFEGRLTLRASSISFDFFLALFPTILFFFTLIPFIPVSGFQQELLELLEDIFPYSIWEFVSTTLEEIITRPRTDLLSLGFFLALLFSTNGINSVIEGFNTSYLITETRSFLKQRLVSLFLVALLSVLVIIAITLFIVGGRVLSFLVKEGILTNNFTFIILQVVRWILIVSLFLFSISFLYYFAPATKKEYKFLSAGSIFTTSLMIIATFGFNFYIENFNRYNALYGSIGTLLVFLLWVYFNSIILLIGFELNVSIKTAKNPLNSKIGDNKK